MGVPQHVHGTDNFLAAPDRAGRADQLGHIGRPGAGFTPPRAEQRPGPRRGADPMVYPDYRSVALPDPVRSVFEAAWGMDASTRPGLTVVEIIQAIRAGRRARHVCFMGENPAMSDPDLNHARESLAELDHLVVQEIFLTETAMLADVVLPATAFPEKTGTFTNTDRRVQLGRQAIPPPARPARTGGSSRKPVRCPGLDWSYGHPWKSSRR
ncbi:MAG: molybdopterin-dependent oxidoreductase [Isosphaeraceae bacterium]